MFLLFSWEIQVADEFTGKGVGKLLIGSLIEYATSFSNVVQIMLTVFKHNPKAFSFFMTQGFKVDDSSPSRYLNGIYSEDYSYEILSFSINRE